MGHDQLPGPESSSELVNGVLSAADFRVKKKERIECLDTLRSTPVEGNK